MFQIESSANEWILIDDLSQKRASAQIRIEQHSNFLWWRAKAWKWCLNRSQPKFAANLVTDAQTFILLCDSAKCAGLAHGRDYSDCSLFCRASEQKWQKVRSPCFSMNCRKYFKTRAHREGFSTLWLAPSRLAGVLTGRLCKRMRRMKPAGEGALPGAERINHCLEAIAGRKMPSWPLVRSRLLYVQINAKRA